MSEEGQEKQYKPSPKRLEDLHKKGQFLRSKEMTGGVVVIGSAVLILSLSDKIIAVLSQNFIDAFAAIAKVLHEPEVLPDLYSNLAWSNFLLILPVLLVLLVLVLAATFMFGGLSYSWSLLHFKGERLSPFKNLKRIFSANNAMELFKAALKFSVLLLILAYFIYMQQERLMAMVGFHDEDNIVEGFDLLKRYLILLMAGVLVIVLTDMIYTFISYQKKTMMTLQEVKDEHKEMDGNPETKQKIRRAQFALSRQRMRQDVPMASVVITNPTHYAVALRYTDGVDKAPTIVAKGKDNIAKEIRALAVKHMIPIYEAPPLARAVYFTGKVGESIHPDLYMAVAIVLSYIYQLKHYQMGLGQMPEKAHDLKIPDELDFSHKN